MTVASLVKVPSLHLDGEVALLSAEAWRDFEHARSLLDAAVEIHAGIQSEREAALASSRDEGFQAGFETGLRKLAAAISAAEAERKRFAALNQDTLLEVAFSLLARIMPELDRETTVLPLLKNALDEIGTMNEITVRVAPAAVEPVRAGLAGQDSWVSGRRIRIIDDPALSGSACVVETSDGVIRLGYGRQLLVMEQALKSQMQND
ncbi:MAG: FliH/SctL family protein [Wenzhouxiangella sp.]